MNNKIKPNYITFEQAKLLKEKGFEVKVRPMYYFEKSIKSGSYMYNPNGVLELCSMPLVGLKNGWVDAITISDMVEWLRLNHGIWIYVKLGYGHEYVIQSTSAPFTFIASEGMFKSPEEAYSAAFDYILKEVLLKP